MPDAEKKAYRQGRGARLNGKSFHDCPYPRTDYMARFWRKGWYSAKAEEKNA